MRCGKPEPLARYSTYRIGGPATVLLPAAAEDVARGAAAGARRRECPWFALGLGSNMLLPDEGLDALVIRLGKGLDQLVRDGDALDGSAPGCRHRSRPEEPRRRGTPGCTSSWACPGPWAAAST